LAYSAALVGSAKLDSLNMRFVGNWPFGLCRAIALDTLRNLTFCGSGGGVYILDVSELSNPTKLSESIHARELIRGLCYSSNFLYVACRTGFDIWDVSDLSNPYKAGSFNISDYVSNVVVSGTYAYVVCINSVDWDWYITLSDLRYGSTS